MADKVSVLLIFPVNSLDAPSTQECLRGISAQSYPSSAIELVQIEYVPGDPAARTSALNAAREGVSGEYVVEASPGMLWDSHKVETQVIRLIENPSAEAVIHPVSVRDSHGKKDDLDLSAMRTYGPRIGALLGLPWGHGACMFRKESYDALGIYRNVEEVQWEYAVRCADRGLELLLLDEELAVWNVASISESGVSTRRSVFPTEIRHMFLTSYLERQTPDALLKGGREPYGTLIKAALYERNDDLGSAHTLCQQVGEASDAPEVSYLHGIVHRREPDFDNARGWFGRAASSEVHALIHTKVVSHLQRVLQIPDYGAARETALRYLNLLGEQGVWDPTDFVTLCESRANGNAEGEETLLGEIQEIEFECLFDFTFRLAKAP